MIRKFRLVATLLLLTILPGLCQTVPPAPADVEGRANSLLKQLTLGEKIDLIVLWHACGTRLNQARYVVLLEQRIVMDLRRFHYETSRKATKARSYEAYFNTLIAAAPSASCEKICVQSRIASTEFVVLIFCGMTMVSPGIIFIDSKLPKNIEWCICLLSTDPSERTTKTRF